MTAARRWLRARGGDAPAELLGMMVDALPAEEGPLPESLAEGALALYERVVTGGGRRADALPLLAADALLTHAIEAQAELDPAGLPAFVEQWGAPGRLGQMVHRIEP